MKIIISEKQLRILEDLEVKPSKSAVKHICDSEKFCRKQGPITFGQFKSLLKASRSKHFINNVGEGGYKALLRLFPWFFPQIAIAGFIGSSLRALNKIIRPTLLSTSNYKKWWAKVITKSLDVSEGELSISDPISKIFFISDGLLTMLSEKHKIEFSDYISELAANKPDDEPVPDFFVENELRKWVNNKFLLDPPLELKNI